MRIRWTEGADSNLDQVEEYIAQDNPPAAVATVNKIIDSAQMLADYPTIGKRGRERGTRELVVAGLSYIVIYDRTAWGTRYSPCTAYIYEIPVTSTYLH